jgi:hypothetical protein
MGTCGARLKPGTFVAKLVLSMEEVSSLVDGSFFLRSRGFEVTFWWSTVVIAKHRTGAVRPKNSSRSAIRQTEPEVNLTAEVVR